MLGLGEKCPEAASLCGDVLALPVPLQGLAFPPQVSRATPIMLGYTHAEHVMVVGHPVRVTNTGVMSFQGKGCSQVQELNTTTPPEKWGHPLPV